MVREPSERGQKRVGGGTGTGNEVGGKKI